MDHNMAVLHMGEGREELGGNEEVLGGLVTPTGIGNDPRHDQTLISLIHTLIDLIHTL